MLGSATARAWRTSGCAGVCVCMCVCKVACSMCVRVCGCAGGWRGDGWGHKALQVATAVLLSPTQPPALPPTHAPLPATHARHAHSSNVACVSACEAWCVTGTHTVAATRHYTNTKTVCTHTSTPTTCAVPTSPRSSHLRHSPVAFGAPGLAVPPPTRRLSRSQATCWPAPAPLSR